MFIIPYLFTMNFVLLKKMLSLKTDETVWTRKDMKIFPEPQASQTQLMEWLQGNKAKRKKRYPTPQKKMRSPKVMNYMELMRMSSGARNKGI